MTNDPLPLTARVRQGDRTALAAYVEDRRPALVAFIERRLGSGLRGKMEPQDVMQELAVKALRELPGTDLTDRDPFGWLCQLAEQCIVDGHRHFAAGKRDSKREVAGSAPVGDGTQDLIALLSASLTSPTQAVVKHERQGRLETALEAFSTEQREALRLRYGVGLPTKEVAQRLGKSDVATRVMLARLVQKLQELLGPGEATVT
jgi:RNA polymerase sigma-70 factor, ECF subfamily